MYVMECLNAFGDNELNLSENTGYKGLLRR